MAWWENKRHDCTYERTNLIAYPSIHTRDVHSNAALLFFISRVVAPGYFAGKSSAAGAGVGKQSQLATPLPGAGAGGGAARNHRAEGGGR